MILLEQVERTSRFRLLHFNEVQVNTRNNYVVKGLVPAESLVVVWGPPKCGKSFLVTDLAMHVALGWPYRGRKVRQGAIIYVACEGSGGFPARLEAFRQRFLADAAAPPFFLLPASLDLVGERGELMKEIAATLGDDEPVMVVLDTVNRSLRGSESSDEDMGNYVKAADAIKETFRCAVVVIHHCGVDGTRPRGHTSLTGAVDTQIAVKKDEAGTITATVEYQKDGPDGEQWHNKLEVVEVATDEDGDPITSCVILPADHTPESGQRCRLTGRQRRALDVLHSLIADHGRPAPDARHYPSGAAVIEVSVWRESLFQAGVLDREATNPRQDFRRLRAGLAERGAIGEWGDLIWSVGSVAA